MAHPEHLELADGARLRLVRGGEPDAEVTVVFVHGYALDHRCWEDLVHLVPSAVERPVQVISYDQRGHGRSTAATANNATVDQLGDDLAELIEGAAPTGRVVVAGHGMGGLAALACAQRHPELFEPADSGPARVAGLVLLSTAARETATEARAATGLAVESGVGLPAMINRLMWDLEAVVGSKVVDLVTDRAHKAAVTAMRWSLFGDDPQDAHLVLALRMIRHHWPKVMAMFRPALDEYVRDAKLTVPRATLVLALVGERDRLVTPEQAAALVEPVPGADVIVLPGLGHMLPLEGTAEVLPRVVAMVHEVQRRLRDSED